MAVRPSVAAGFRLAVRLHRLVAGVWLAWVAIFVPALLVVQSATGPYRANRPAGGFGAGEDLLIFSEIMRPVAVPLAVALVFGCFLLLAWCVLWHAGVVRWWLNPDTDAPGLAQILGHGLPVWWRFARLTLLALVLQVVGAVSPWLPLLLADVEHRFVLPLLVFGSVLTVVATILVWLAAFRGGWLLGEPGRRSALLAWVRGLGMAVRQPLRSLLPLLIWALPGLALLVLPLLYDGPAATLFLLAAWLLGAFCMVALFMSYAPPKPPPARKVSPLEPPTAPYVTTRFPTLLRDE
jgi:hypothetical protein